MNNQLTFTDILNAQTVEDLKKLGQIKINGEKRALGPNGLRKIMQEYLSINTLSLKGKKQYESFFQFLQKLKTLR